MTGDLTTVRAVKQYLDIKSDTDDALLQRLITGASAFLRNWTNNNILYQKYQEVRDGNDSDTLVAGNWPVRSVASLSVNNISIPAAVNGSGPGYEFDDKAFYLVSGLNIRTVGGGIGTFVRGRRNISIAYVAGSTQSEQATIPANSPYTISADSLLYPWSGDVSVEYVGGNALALVTTAPAAGQYNMGLTGTYTFAAADAGKAVLITYVAPPADVEQVCLDAVARRYRKRSRIDEVSKSLAGETVSFSQRDLTAEMRSMLFPYKRVVPI